MIYKIFFSLSLLFTGVGLQAQSNYAVSKIDPALLKGASAVKRFELMRLEIKDAGNAVHYYKTAITILNENGDEHAGWQEMYDKFRTIRNVNATLFDAAGGKIKSLKNSEIRDISAAGESLAEDSRVKSHSFYHKNYPYTIEYEVEIKQNGLLFLPSWRPVEDQAFSVEKSVFEVACPSDFKIRYKAFNYPSEPVVKNGKENIYHWEVNNLNVVNYEFASLPLAEITPSVFVAPVDFEIDGFKGAMDSWTNFGKFQILLNQNRDQLPENIKAAIHQLVDTVSDKKSKIALLYKYMQGKTRYISIQLGIGGWQPLEASFVASKGYGDCKALTNYMYSILKEAGIKSCYTLIKAGNSNHFYLPDFPSLQANHAILSVPLEKDTVWLECTDQTLPAGYLSGFTANRYALMIDEDGGHLVRTPRYNFQDNEQIRKIKAIVDETGKLNADIETQYSGLQQDELFSLINTYSRKEQLEYLKKEIDLPNYDITSFDYKTIKSKIPSIDESLKLVADHYAAVSGKRLFIQPNLLTKDGLRLKDEERKFDINLVYEYRDVDTVEIVVPNGYTSESTPQPVSLSTKFGQYKISYRSEGNTIYMTRLFERKAGRYPAADYPELVKMYAEMYKADRGKVVLVKKEG